MSHLQKMAHIEYALLFFLQEKLCVLYGKSAEELGILVDSSTDCTVEELELVDIIQLSDDSPDEVHLLMKGNLITYLEMLSVSLYDSVQEVYAALFQAIREFSTMEPDAIDKKREALRHLALLPLLLKKIQKPALSIIHQFAAGVTVCGLLSNGTRDDMMFAFTTVSAYLPNLEWMVQDVHYQKQTATVLSQALRIKQRLAYHLENLKNVLVFETCVTCLFIGTSCKIASIERGMMMEFEQGYRSTRQAWIDGVNEFHPAPKASYTLPWEQMPSWEQEAVKSLYHEVRTIILPGLKQGIRIPAEHGGYLVSALWNILVFQLLRDPKPSYVKHFNNLDEWQQKTDIKMFEAIESAVLQEISWQRRVLLPFTTHRASSWG